MLHDRFDTEICGVCGRQAIGIGYSAVPSRNSSPVMWLCDDADCIEIAKVTYSMKQDVFNRIESLAAGRGGEEGGAYLDQIGKTNLETLTPDEWYEFLRRIIGGYRKALKNDLKNEAPF